MHTDAGKLIALLLYLSVIKRKHLSEMVTYMDDILYIHFHVKL